MAKRETDRASKSTTGSMVVKRGLAEMLKGGVIMDVVNPEQAIIAEDAGACAVMALERVPADIRRDGGVARMSDPEMINGIQAVCSIPVMAKARIGHFVEAQVLESLGVDFIDESEVLTPADESHHIDKFKFTVPFVCGTPDFSVPTLDLLANHPLIELKMVISMPDRPAGRGMELKSPEVIVYAKEKN
ncbi:MAG: hypothetical protein ACKO2E_06945, partial [Actinomycetota bacterium]